MKLKSLASLALSCLLLVVTASEQLQARPNGYQPWKGVKYCFFFIGDGMASPQIHAAEAYLAALQEDDALSGGIKAEKLFLSKMPVQGMQMSFANNRFITGSAAAGTALASGKKTNIGVIGMNPDATAPYSTLAEKAKAKGMKVGIISSVSIDHATPAVFYAHTSSRNNYEDIDFQLLSSGFDYFGGGGFRVNKWVSPEYAGLSNKERYALVESTAVANGFTYADNRTEFEAATGKVIAVNPWRDGSNAMPYAMDREAFSGPGQLYEGCITLAEFTQKGIDLMEDNPKGFFMMVEGGKIDWACHANDARAAIEDTIAFDNAVKVAVDFARMHPQETLIVVTGDHECGGMTLGFAGTGYNTGFEKLAKQTVSYDHFNSNILPGYSASCSDIDAPMWQIILDCFGLDGAGLTAENDDDLSEFQIAQLEDAFDKTMFGTSSNLPEEDKLLYGYYKPLTVTLTHILNRRAGLAWTSYSHTAVPVPVLATGKDAWRFGGYYDNTDVAKKIARALKVKLDR